ncbi:MAG: Coenzyme F420 hydrogenase/dehydrogenase, beta subunit C-terminal domain [Hadesarchaea archaeon]|nr:Coenzyme F420 hydrogenase/dehydrogenase, beta subunit C-terminal domain [Hadesarchaea archaeon]
MKSSSKLDFNELSNNVISRRLCVDCGACVAACPSNVLVYEQGTKLVGECKNCGICTRVCPRYKSLVTEMENFVFGRQRKIEEDFGIFKQVLVARSTNEDILRKSQDGGVVTTLLISALESGLINGAITSRVDPTNPWLPLPSVATTPDELIANAGTRYSPSPGLIALKDCLKAGLDKIAFVGTPCQILAIRRIQKFLPKYAKSLVFTIGLFCAENFSYNGLMISKIQNELGINLNDIKKTNIKGKFLIYLKTGEVQEISLKEAKKFVIPSCQYCGDFSAELADISCGGVGLDGWTYTIIRTDEGSKVFDNAVKGGMLRVESPGESPTKLLVKMSKGKRSRANRLSKDS